MQGQCSSREAMVAAGFSSTQAASEQNSATLHAADTGFFSRGLLTQSLMEGVMEWVSADDLDLLSQ